MSTVLLDALRQAHRRNLCIKPYCTTCGCQDFRALLQALPNMAQELESLDPAQFPQSRDFLIAVMWSFRSLPSQSQRDGVLAAWARHVPEHVRFADDMVFDVIGEDDFETPAGKAFLAAVVEVALRTGDISLTESLVRRLGQKTRQFPELLDQAKKLGEANELVYKALVQAAFCVSKQEIEAQARRSKKLFSAISRNDEAAVRALLKKHLDLTTVNEQGQTAAEYATSCGNHAIRNLIESSQSVPLDKEVPVAKDEDDSTWEDVREWPQFFGNQQ